MEISIKNNLISSKDIELAFPSDTEALSSSNAELALERAKEQNEARKRINEDIRSVCSRYFPSFDPTEDISQEAENVSQDIELALCVAVAKGKKITRQYVCTIITNRLNDTWRVKYREEGLYTGVERKDHHPLRCEPRRISYDEIADGLLFDDVTNSSFPISYQRLGETPASLGMNPEVAIQAKDFSQHLNEAVESAGEKDRARVATVWLRVVEERTNAEIAKIFGRTERTIKRWYREGCEYLHNWLKNNRGIERECLFT
jgi:RNA polymerase sigma factor (sigma-70 family)